MVLHWNWKTESYCDDDDVLVSASWECACGAGDLNLANRPDAAAGARSHWRRELRVALEALEQS